MQGSRTAKASLLPAPKARRTRALRTRRPNNTCMTAPKAGGGYAAALQPQSAEARGQGEQNKRQRIDKQNAGQPPPPAPAVGSVLNATAGAAAGALPGAVADAPADAACTQQLPNKCEAIMKAVQELQQEQASTTLLQMQLKSQLSDKEEELLQVQRTLHVAKFEREKLLVQNSELRATLQEMQDKEAENIKLRASLQEMTTKEASKTKLTNQLKLHMRQTAETMVALGYATQPMPEAPAELSFSPGAALSNQATPMSQEVQASQASQSQEANSQH